MSYTHTYELHSHMCHTHTWTKLRCIIAFWRAPSLATPSYPPFFSPRHIYESYIPRYTYKSCINNAEPSWHFDEPTPSRLHPILSSFHRATYMNNIRHVTHINHVWTIRHTIVALWQANSLEPPSYPLLFAPCHIHESYIPFNTGIMYEHHSSPWWHFDEPTP